MGIRRTKEEKLAAQLRRLEETSYSLSPQKKSSSSKKSAPKSIKAAANSRDAIKESPVIGLLSQEPRQIKRDLWRTIVASLVVFGILIALYFQL